MSRSRTVILFLIFIVLYLSVAGVLAPLSYVPATGSPAEELGVMRPDPETRKQWIRQYNAAPKAGFDPTLEAGYPTSFSLLNHIQYVPSERSQESCGNCWAWAGTGVSEVALDVQGVNKDRLSVQYLNSNYNGGTGSGFACCGGWLQDFASYYSSQGFIIPWSNTNAAWADGARACGGQTSVPAATISVSPKYPITSVTAEVVPTQAAGQATAISNIKNTLTQNKAVWFGFFMATASDGNAFQSFWWNQGEGAVWDPDPYSGHVYADGWGHAVLVVGYDDTNPSNRYWIILNSWGTANGGRSNGLYRMKMDMNYDAYFYDPQASAYYSLYFQTLDITFQSEYTVTFYTDPTSGTIDANGLTMTNGDTGTYDSGTRVHIVANSLSGYSFASWEVSGVAVDDSSSSDTNMTVSDDGWLKAYFSPQVSMVSSVIFPAPEYSEWFIGHTNPYDNQALLGVWAKATNLQDIGPWTHVEWVDQATGRPLVSGNLVLVAGPLANKVVSYYQSQGFSVGFRWSFVSGVSYGQIIYRGQVLAQMREDEIGSGKDIFVVQAIRDSDGRFVILLWGIGAQGTLASGVWFVSNYSTLGSMTNSIYVYSWTDANGDKFPQPGEITLTYQGN